MVLWCNKIKQTKAGDSRGRIRAFPRYRWDIIYALHTVTGNPVGDIGGETWRSHWKGLAERGKSDPQRKAGATAVRPDSVWDVQGVREADRQRGDPWDLRWEESLFH